MSQKAPVLIPRKRIENISTSRCSGMSVIVTENDLDHVSSGIWLITWLDIIENNAMWLRWHEIHWFALSLFCRHVGYLHMMKKCENRQTATPSRLTSWAVIGVFLRIISDAENENITSLYASTYRLDFSWLYASAHTPHINFHCRSTNTSMRMNMCANSKGDVAQDNYSPDQKGVCCNALSFPCVKLTSTEINLYCCTLYTLLEIGNVRRSAQAHGCINYTWSVGFRLRVSDWRKKLSGDAKGDFGEFWGVLKLANFSSGIWKYHSFQYDHGFMRKKNKIIAISLWDFANLLATRKIKFQIF